MQTAVPASQEIAQAGQVADLGNHDIVSMSFVDRETTAQVDTITIVTAVVGDTYTARVNGVEKSYVALAGNTTSDIATALAALMLADTGITDYVTPLANAATIGITDAADTPFITTVDGTVPANISLAHTTAGVYADDEMPFGIGVFAGTDWDECIVPNGSGTFLGVSVLDHSYPNISSDGSVVTSGGPVGVMRKGRIWVVVDQAITVGAAVYVRHTGSAAEVRGSFRVDADTADAQVVSAGARWASVDQVVNGVRIAKLELNLPA